LATAGGSIDLHAVGRIAVRVERAEQHENIAQHLILIVLDFLEILQPDRRDAAVDGSRRNSADRQLVRAGADEQPHVLPDGELELAVSVGCSVVRAGAAHTKRSSTNWPSASVTGGGGGGLLLPPPP
jgi:hypothetical protein